MILATYAFAVGGVLLLAGAALTVLDRILGKDVSAIWKTWRGWLIMIPIVFAVLWAGRVATIVGVALLSIAGFREFARATGLARDRLLSGAVVLGVIAATTFSLIRMPGRELPGMYGMYMALPVYAVALLWIVPVLRNRTDGALRRVSLAIVGFVYFGWMFGHVGMLANTAHFHGYVLYLVFAVELNDVAAFTFGKLFGRRRLLDRVSPNKTVAGALGALGVSMLLPWLLRFSFPHFGPRELLLTGLIVGVGGQLGDLTISVIKRDLGVKDMGTLIPGHGGVLDRVDSLIYVAPLFFHMARFFAPS